MMRNIIYVVGFCLLAACAPSRKAGDSLLSVPEQFPERPAADTAGIGRMPWRSFFNEVPLQGYIEQAVAHNFDVRQALKNIEMAGQQLRQTRQEWLPELGISANASRSRNTGSEVNKGMERRENGFSIPLQFSWEIDIWGKIRNANQAARAEYLQSGEAHRAVLSSVVAQVASAYYTLDLLRIQESVARQSLALNDSMLTMLNIRYEMGEIPLSSVQQAEAQRRSDRLTVLRIENETGIQKNVLALLTGQTTPMTPVSGCDNVEPSEKQLGTGVPAQLLENRPDVKAAELELQAANARVGIARKNFYPALTIGGRGGLREADLSNLFSVNKAMFGLIEGALYQPLFNRGKLKRELAMARITKEKAEIGFQQAFTSAYVEVADALLQISNLEQQQTEAALRSRDLIKAAHNSRKLFENGMTSYIEVLTIQRDLLQAQLEEAAITSRLSQAQTELYRALGGGWQ